MTRLNLPQTPATCANVALHNLYPGQIDLVVSLETNLYSRSHSFARFLALTLVAIPQVRS